MPVYKITETTSKAYVYHIHAEDLKEATDKADRNSGMVIAECTKVIDRTIDVEEVTERIRERD